MYIMNEWWNQVHGGCWEQGEEGPLWEVEVKGAWSRGWDENRGKRISLWRRENGLEWMKVRRRGRGRGWWKKEKRVALSGKKTTSKPGWSGEWKWSDGRETGTDAGISFATWLLLPPHLHFIFHLIHPHFSLLSPVLISPFVSHLFPSSHRVIPYCCTSVHLNLSSFVSSL